MYVNDSCKAQTTLFEGTGVLQTTKRKSEDEDEHLARENTNKWAAKSNKGSNGKYFCVGILSSSSSYYYYYSTTKLVFILFFSNYI